MKLDDIIRWLTVLFLFGYCPAYAQLENVRIETYYLSDADDATDTFGGYLPVGSKTYRIYVDLVQGSKLVGIYGDEDHPLVFSSTEPFFNHKEDGVTFGKDINRSRYENGTVPLDTYITIGQCSKSFGQGAYFGVPKEEDQDGSLVGGENNDGGSQEIESGLLKNQSSQSGIPLTEADGLMIKSEVPASWIDIGFKDILDDVDTTIFGLNDKLYFKSENVLLRLSGITGVDTLQNEILLAQLTTLGQLSFEINLEVEIIAEGKIIHYVARNEALDKDEEFNPLLKYPYVCGCTDPDYMEASTLFACTDNSQCFTPVVLGCMDTLACNFNAEANFNIPELCCYVGYCHDLDISAACPDLDPRFVPNLEHVRLYPNPAINEMRLSLDFVLHNEIGYTILNMFGQTMQKGVIAEIEKYLPVDALAPGCYALQLHFQDKSIAIPFVKL